MCAAAAMNAVMKVDKSASTQIPRDVLFVPRKTTKNALVPGTAEFWAAHVVFYWYSLTFQDLQKARAASKRLRKASDSD